MVGGLQVSDTTKKWSYAVAMEAFGIVAGRNCRKDMFPGYIIYYYEMAQMAFSPPTASSAAADSAANWYNIIIFLNIYLNKFQNMNINCLINNH
jgi:hypothetical protein